MNIELYYFELSRTAVRAMWTIRSLLSDLVLGVRSTEYICMHNHMYVTGVCARTNIAETQLDTLVFCLLT